MSRSHPRICPSRRHPSRAFTLAELLVVIGIIAVLIAIVMPSLAGARRESQQVACKAQLQQIGYAVRMYADQNRGRYPLAPSLPSVNPNNYTPLHEALASYVGNTTGVFRCPSDTIVFPAEGTSYFYYAELGEWPLAKTFLYAVYDRDVTRIPVLWDADRYHGRSYPYNSLFVDGHVEHFLQASVQQ